MQQLVLDVIHGIRSLKHTIKVLAPNAPSGARCVNKFFFLSFQLGWLAYAGTDKAII